MMKKPMVLIMVLCLLLAGCSPMTAQSRDEDSLVLTLATSFTSKHISQTYHELSNRFAAEYGIDIVDRSTLTGAAYVRQIINDFAAGSEPDVFYLTAADAATMIDNNQVVSVQEICRKYPQYASNIQSAIMADTADENGNNWYVPVIGRYQALYCNTALFEACGAPLPTTWDQFLEAARIFQEHDVAPIAAGFKGQSSLWVDQLVLSMGVPEHACVPRSAGEVPNTWRQALSRLAMLRSSGVFPTGALTDTRVNAQSAFAGGEAAMILESSDLVPMLTDPENVYVCAFPCMPPRTGQEHLIIQVNSGYFISRKTWENESLREAAVSFVMAMTSTDTIAAITADGGGYPTVLLDAASLPSGQSALAKSALALCRRAQVHYSMQDRVSRMAWSTLIAAVEPIMQGRGSIEDTIRSMFDTSQPQ